MFINACCLLWASPSLSQFGRGRLSLVAISFYLLSLLFEPCCLSEFTLAGPHICTWLSTKEDGVQLTCLDPEQMAQELDVLWPSTGINEILRTLRPCCYCSQFWRYLKTFPPNIQKHKRCWNWWPRFVSPMFNVWESESGTKWTFLNHRHKIHIWGVIQ